MSPRPSRTRRLSLTLSAATLVLGSLAACSEDAPSVSQPSTPAGSTSSAPAATSSAPSSPAPSTTEAPTPTPSTSTPPAAPSTAPSPASSTVAGERSDAVKLCGADTANSDNKTCGSAASTVKGSAIYCSADLPNDVRGNVDAVFYRNGSEVYSASVNRTGGVGALIVNYSVGKLQLPGGDYTCAFKGGGKTYLNSTKVDGPDGRATQGMACDGSTMYSQSNVTHCESNSSTLTNPSSVGCSAMVTDLKGRSVSATLETPEGPKSVNMSNNFELGSAVVYLRAPAAAFPGGIPSGAYTCSFKVDNQAVINIPFTVS